MAQAPQSPGGNDNFIRRIVTDPKNVPDVMLLTGYLGASSEEAHERLYLSADLTNYVEIPNTAILHQAPLPKEQDAHGGVTLWVRKDAALQYKMAPAAQALANYFAGAIQAGAQGAPGGAGAAVGPRATIGVHCATFNCSLHCATEITPCINTHANTCFCPVTHACPSQNQLCQSQGACTYVGCGASLACTQGLLCGGVAAGAAAAPQGFGGQAQQAQAAFAGQANLPQSFVGACLSHHFTCAPCPNSAPATVHVRLHTAAAMCSSEDCRLTMCDLLYQLHASSGLLGERFRHLQCHFVWGPWSDAAAVPPKFRSTDTVRRRRPGTGAAWDASRAAASVSFAGELFGGVLHKGAGHMQPDGGHALHPVGDINL